MSVSNNHAGDLDRNEFFQSVAVLQSHNFNVFGWNKHPFFDINENIRIISGSMWSNRDSDYVFKLENAVYHIKPGICNILYPHFGYEFELYPRPTVVEKAKDLIQKFDAVVGHHSHCPQPLTVESVEGVNKVLAYSLGDFLSIRATKNYQYGIVMKVALGQNGEGGWLLDRVEWRLTKCTPLPNRDFIVGISNDCI